MKAVKGLVEHNSVCKVLIPENEKLNVTSVTPNASPNAKLLNYSSISYKNIEPYKCSRILWKLLMFKCIWCRYFKTESTTATSTYHETLPFLTTTAAAESIIFNPANSNYISHCIHSSPRQCVSPHYTPFNCLSSSLQYLAPTSSSSHPETRHYLFQ